MYLESGDLIALIIALGCSIAVVITSAVANARLTKSRDYWRQIAIMSDKDKELWFAPDCSCGNNQAHNVR